MMYALCPLKQLDIFTVLFSNNAALNCLQLKKKRRLLFFYVAVKLNKFTQSKFTALQGSC